MNNNPYLSVVIIGRNDDYMKNGFERMKMSVQNFIHQAGKYHISMELIIVDWNPPQDKPLLKDALLVSNMPDCLSVRFIVVPHSIHETYKSSAKIKLINAAAFNVGIRRARGEFVLATNSDILFSDELMRFISQKQLSKDCFYRAFRYDVNREVLKHGVQEIMEFCRENVVHAFLENSPLSNPHGLPNHPVLQTDCGGDFVLFSKIYWNTLHGYPENNNLGLAADVLLCYMAYLSGLREVVLQTPMRVYHIDHDSRWRGLAEGKVSRLFRNKVYNRLDQKSILKKIIKKANNINRKISNFFTNIFYSKLGFLLKKFSSPDKRDFNVKYLSFESKKILSEMLKGQRPYAYNGDNWGFPKEHFLEFIKET